MSNLIQIKRSLNTSVPGSLANGELAYTANLDVLYIGSNGAVVAIGGKRVPGTLTANQAMVTNATSYMDVIKTANLYINTTSVNVINLVSNSSVLGAATNSELTSTWAIKNYVDLHSAGGTPGGANTQVQFNDSASFNGTAGMVFDKSTNNFTVANNVLVGANVYMNTSAVFVGNSSVNAYLNQTSLYFNGAAAVNAANYVGTANNANNLIGVAGANFLQNTQSRILSGNLEFSGANVFFDTAWTINAVPGAAGNSVSANVTTVLIGNGSVFSTVNATTFSQTANNASNLIGVAGANFLQNTQSRILSGNLNFTGANNFFSTGWFSGANVSANVTAHFVGNATVNAYMTQSLVTVINATSTANLTAGALTIGSAVINATQLTIGTVSATDGTFSGNLTINGTLVTVDATNLSIKDSLIKLADSQTAANTIDIGLYGLYGNATNTYYTGLYMDHADSQYWKFFTTQKEPTTTVDSSNVTYAVGTLKSYLIGAGGGFVANSSVVNITANSTVSSALVANSLTLTTALAGSSGGTGALTTAAGDILVGNSSNAWTKLAVGTDGYVLQVSGSAVVWNTLDGGTF